jgi:Tfp pilus assembly PilM family ATPase
MSTTAGVDIGSETIKAVVLRAGKNGALELTGAGSIGLGELGHMEDGIDKNLAIRGKLKELARTARISADTRRCGISGKNTSIKYLQVPPVPPERLDMLVKYEVEEKGGESDSTYDYRILDVPEVGGQYTVLIGVCKEAASTELMDMARGAGLGEVEVDLEALALYNAYYHGHGHGADMDKTVLIADIGADDITLLLCRHGLLYFARTIMGGGRRFTEVLAAELKIDLIEAEDLKKTAAEIKFDVLPPGASASRTGRIPLRSGMTGIIPRPGQGGSVSRLPAVGDASGSRAPAASTPGSPAVSTGETQRVPAAPAASATSPASASSAAAQAVEQPVEQTLFVLPPMPPPMPQPPVMPPASDDVIVDLPPSLESLEQSLAAPASAPSASATQPLINLALPGADSADDKRKRQMSAALVREAASLCAMLENAVMTSKQQMKMRDLKVDRLYVTGGGSRLKGLVEYLGRRMRMEVQPLQPFKQLSLAKLPPAQAAALNDEQHNMSVAVGLALGDLRPNALAFLLWPMALQQKKIWWSRGAYLLYAAALVALSLGVLLWAPQRNAQALAANADAAKTATDAGRRAAQNLENLRALNEQRRKEFEQLYENTHSGQYFLKLLDELKNKDVIDDDIYLTQITTNVPEVVRLQWSKHGEGSLETPGKSDPKPDAADMEEQSFQAQRRVYLRGFARSTRDDDLLGKIETFKKKLVPDPFNPDSKANWLFKQVDTFWQATDNQSDRAYKLREFVLEAYLEVPQKEAEKPDSKTPPKPAPVKPAPAKAEAPAGGEPKAAKKFVMPEAPGN